MDVANLAEVILKLENNPRSCAVLVLPFTSAYLL